MKSEIKYKPINLNEVIYPNIGVERLVQGYGNGALSGHVILHGPNGTGKSTIANLLPYAISGPDAMVEDKNYDALLAQKDIKGYLQRSYQWSQLTGSTKYFLVFHELDYTKYNLSHLWTAMDDLGQDLMVIITTNNPMGIPLALRSRCALIDMPALSANAVLSRAQHILQAEGLTLPDSQVLAYLENEEQHGDIRSYMRALDQVMYLNSVNLPLPLWSPVHRATAPKFTVV
jgi:replication-associated recombination protein RarA